MTVMVYVMESLVYSGVGFMFGLMISDWKSARDAI